MLGGAEFVSFDRQAVGLLKGQKHKVRLLGAAKAVHIVTPTATVRRLVNMTALAVVDAGAERGNLALRF